MFYGVLIFLASRLPDVLGKMGRIQSNKKEMKGKGLSCVAQMVEGKVPFDRKTAYGVRLIIVTANERVIRTRGGWALLVVVFCLYRPFIQPFTITICA